MKKLTKMQVENVFIFQLIIKSFFIFTAFSLLNILKKSQNPQQFSKNIKFFP